jgi:hypothetical protein
MDQDKKTPSGDKSSSQSIDWKTPVRDDRISKNQDKPVRPAPSAKPGKVKW